MKILTIGVALALGFSASVALACDHGDKMGKAGMTPEEHQKMNDEMFAKIDTNKDGSISKDEFAKHHENMMEKHQDKMKDHDHDAKGHEHHGAGHEAKS